MQLGAEVSGNASGSMKSCLTGQESPCDDLLNMVCPCNCRFMGCLGEQRLFDSSLGRGYEGVEGKKRLQAS